MSSCTWKLIVYLLELILAYIQIVTVWTTRLLCGSVYIYRSTCHCLCPEWRTSYHCDKPSCHQLYQSSLLHSKGNPVPLPQLWMLYKYLIHLKLQNFIWNPPEGVIFCTGCTPIPGLELHPELHVPSLCQIMYLVISKPKVLIVVTKPTLVISPVPVKVLSRFSIITSPLNNLSNMFF